MSSAVSDDIHRRPIRTQAARHNRMRLAVTLHRTLRKRQRCLAIPPFRGENLKHLTFVIDSPPQIVSLAIDLYEDLVEVLAPVRICVVMKPTFPYLDYANWAEPVPPESYRLMADVDAPFMKKVFNIAER
jgi:hypothetical protein